ncbi:MAG: hypothetical protein ICV51_14785 [Flavisolibacter sp.]|nr:hypothetical protein [Flavisolibacter sp.]
MYKWGFIAIIVLFASCGRGKKKPDVSDIKVNVQIERFEQSFFKIDTNNIATGLMHLRNAFPSFYPVFIRDILGVNPIDTASLSVIRTILSSYRSLNDSLQQKYSNLNWLQRELSTGFKYVKYYYPKYIIPRIITFIGTLDAPGVVLTQQDICIGLHQYAGKNFSAYGDVAVQELYPAYISRRFDKEYMAANCLKAVVDDVYPDQSAGRPLIEQMVEKGKQWYLLDHFLPDAPDSIKTGFTQKQLNWVKENEGNVWAYIIKNENIYTVEPQAIQTYIGEAPFTQGMPEASPGNIGQWIGWRIVQQFADKNEKQTVQQVLETPTRKVFEGAGYRPK